MAEIQFAPAGKDLPAISKQRHIHDTHHMPAIFRIQNQAVVVIEAEGQKSTKVLRAPEDRLHVKRDGLATFGIGQGGLGPQSQHARFIEKSKVLLDFGIQALKVMQVQLLVPIPCVLKGVEPAVGGILRIVGIVQLSVRTITQEIGLMVDSRSNDRRKNLVGRRELFDWPGPIFIARYPAEPPSCRCLTGFTPREASTLVSSSR